MKYADLNKEDLIHTPIDESHYGNDFNKKFIGDIFDNDYDIGESSVYRTKEDMDRDTLAIIDEMNKYVNSGVDKTSNAYKERMAYYDEMIKNPPTTTINYDFKGVQELIDLIASKKHGISYDPELITEYLARYGIRSSYT
jgi:hypothetical protein